MIFFALSKDSLEAANVDFSIALNKDPLEVADVEFFLALNKDPLEVADFSGGPFQTRSFPLALEPETTRKGKEMGSIMDIFCF